MRFSLGLLVLSVVNFIAVLVAVLLLGNNVPIHFNSSFEVIKMGSPAVLLLIAVLPIFCGMGLLIDSKIRKGSFKNSRLIQVVLYSVAFLIIYVNWLMVGISSSSLGVGHKLSLPVDVFVYIPIGIFLIIVGLLVNNIKQRNRFFGTESSEAAKHNAIWEKAHKLGSKFFIISGAFIVLASIIAYFTEIWWISVSALVIAFAALTVIPLTYARVANKVNIIETDEKIKELKESGLKDSEVIKENTKSSKNKKTVVEINDTENDSTNNDSGE